MNRLTARQRDQSCYALEDICKLLCSDPRKVRWEDLDDVMTLLESRNLQLAPIEPEKPEDAPKEGEARLTRDEEYRVRGYGQSLDSMRNMQGFVFKWDAMEFMTRLVYRLAGLSKKKPPTTIPPTKK